ncbi:MAG: Gfo/Idh/MocA family oxidoreductase [Armatimonadetes bacterium]|nr:Gfo/Idh/MocA family oxidoreductase [Armatimonadota bacterium]
MEPIRVGFIGVGQIAKHHLNTYANLPGVQVVAACDINEEELARVAQQHTIPFTTTDFRELIARDEVEAVDVCLHNNFHAPMTIAALQAGKHVYCEKPMAGAYVDAKAMLDTARECGRNLSIQLAQLYSKETKIAKRLIDEGQLGKLYHARTVGHRRRGRPFVDGYGTASFVQKRNSAGGALYDMGVYHISQILYLLGRPPVERISGKTYQETGMDAERRETSGYDVEELGLGLVRCADGVTIDVLEAWAIHLAGLGSSCVVGSKGGIQLSPFSFHTTHCDIEMNATFEVDSTDWRWHQLDPLQACYDSPQAHWLAALQGKVELLPTAEIALQTMLISEGIYLSNRLGREVTAEEVLTHSVSTAAKV